MLTNNVIKALQEYLTIRKWGNVHPVRSLVDKSYPLITIADLSSEEHEVLDGVYSVSIEVALETIPNSTENEGTPEEEMDELSNKLGKHLQCEALLTSLNNYAGLKVFDIQLAQIGNEVRDGRNTATATLDIVSCNT